MGGATPYYFEVNISDELGVQYAHLRYISSHNDYP